MASGTVAGGGSGGPGADTPSAAPLVQSGAARSAPPSRGHSATGHAPGHACLNCGTALMGAFCHGCGQDAHVHRTLGSIGHDVLHGAFHFEGRIFRTLPMLLRDPGGLTRRYIAGERVRFVQPLALFLFCTFLMFAAIHAVGPDAGELGHGLHAAAGQAPRIDAEIARQRIALAQATAGPAQDPDRADNARAALASLAVARRVALNGGGAITGLPRIDRAIDRVREDPALAIYEFQANAYKFSWALIPISAPLVALLFVWRRRFTMYDHAIFVTYSLSFMLLLATVLTLAGAAGLPAAPVAAAAVCVPPAHMFRQLRGTYALRRRSALWRTAALVALAMGALLVFLALLIALGLAG